MARQSKELKSHVYDDLEDWLSAIEDGKKRHIMTAALAAESLGIAANTITKKINSDAVPTITIDDRKFVRIDYVLQEVRRKEDLYRHISEVVEGVAKRGETDVYSSLMKKVGLEVGNPQDRNTFSNGLALASRHALETHGVFLTSIVHRKAAGSAPTRPGKGYKDLIEQIHKEKNAPDFFFDPDESEQDMVDRHMKEVWAVYSKL